MQAVVTSPLAPSAAPTGTVFVPDARVVVPPGMSATDPAHPHNLQRRLAALQTQSAADTKYDPAPPPYVEQVAAGAEGFCGPRWEAERRAQRLAAGATCPVTPLLAALLALVLGYAVVSRAPTRWRHAALTVFIALGATAAAVAATAA